MILQLSLMQVTYVHSHNDCLYNLSATLVTTESLGLKQAIQQCKPQPKKLTEPRVKCNIDLPLLKHFSLSV